MHTATPPCRMNGPPVGLRPARVNRQRTAARLPCITGSMTRALPAPLPPPAHSFVNGFKLHLASAPEVTYPGGVVLKRIRGSINQTCADTGTPTAWRPPAWACYAACWVRDPGIALRLLIGLLPLRHAPANGQHRAGARRRSTACCTRPPACGPGCDGSLLTCIHAVRAAPFRARRPLQVAWRWMSPTCRRCPSHVPTRCSCRRWVWMPLVGGSMLWSEVVKSRTAHSVGARPGVVSCQPCIITAWTAKAWAAKQAAAGRCSNVQQTPAAPVAALAGGCRRRPGERRRPRDAHGQPSVGFRGPARHGAALRCAGSVGCLGTELRNAPWASQPCRAASSQELAQAVVTSMLQSAVLPSASKAYSHVHRVIVPPPPQHSHLHHIHHAHHHHHRPQPPPSRSTPNPQPPQPTTGRWSSA